MDFLLTFIGKSGLAPKQAEAFIKTFRQTMLDGLVAGGEIALPGIGKFKVVDKAARTGRDFASGKTVVIEAHKAVRFTPSQALKAKVN